jgi:hypothetical protein
MKYKGNLKGAHEYVITLEHRLVAPIWISKLLSTNATVEKIIFKQNKLGVTKLKVFIKNINHSSIMQDIDSRVQIDITRFINGINNK